MIVKVLMLFLSILALKGETYDLFDEGCKEELTYERSDVFHEISIEEGYRLYQKNIVFIDSRSQPLFDKGTIKNAINIPADLYETKRESLIDLMEKNIVIFCSGIHCGKSAALAEKMVQDGFQNIYVLKEGYPGWKLNNLPVTIRSTANDPYALNLEDFKKYKNQAVAIDVRTKEEYNNGHIEGAFNIPIKQKKEDFLNALPKNKNLLFICQTGSRAYDACIVTSKTNTFKNIKIKYFDGIIECDCNNKCTMEGLED